MKILFLPHNIASIATNSIDAINESNENSAKGFFVNKYKHQAVGSKSCFYFVGISRLRNPVRWLVQEIRRFIVFRKLIKWADVIHWIYDDAGLNDSEKRILSRLKKPSVIEWVGSDVRDPDILFPINRYYQMIFNNGYEYANYESHARSLANQQKFINYGALPLVNPEINLFVNEALFPKRFWVWPRMPVKKFVPQFPNLEKRKPLILHSPTAKVAKGSSYIIDAIESLKEELDFDFVLLTNLPRSEVLKLMKECDIFIDQLILGMYGLASCEAMCYGKPVVCYLMPAVLENELPEDCPIVNANIYTIKDKLDELIRDASLRARLGVFSREYAEKYFDATTSLLNLIDIYKSVLRQK